MRRVIGIVFPFLAHHFFLGKIPLRDPLLQMKKNPFALIKLMVMDDEVLSGDLSGYKLRESNPVVERISLFREDVDLAY
jgi:hypothetical protein